MEGLHTDDSDITSDLNDVIKKDSSGTYKVNQQNSRPKTEQHKLSTSRSKFKQTDVTLFYEPIAVVIDVIRDENHPVFKNKNQSRKIDLMDITIRYSRLFVDWTSKGKTIHVSNNNQLIH